MIDIRNEIAFQTTRSGGKGGQNVNKVETAVLGSFHIAGSTLLTEEQKQVLLHKLAHRLTKEGWIQVRSQTHRSQLANKDEVVERMNELIDKSLKKKKSRIATRPNRGSIEKRIESKKRKAEVKSGRRRLRPGE